MSLYDGGHCELGYFFISEDVKKRDVKKIEKIAEKHMEEIQILYEKMEEVKQKFFDELEQNGYDNMMGVLTYKK